MKKHMVLCIQLVAMIVLLCFYRIIEPQVMQYTARSYDILPRTLLFIIFYFLLGHLFALPKYFVKGKVKFNPFATIAVSLAVFGLIFPYFPLQINFYFYAFNEITSTLSCIIGYFIVDCIKTPIDRDCS